MRHVTKKEWNTAIEIIERALKNKQVCRVTPYDGDAVMDSYWFHRDVGFNNNNVKLKTKNSIEFIEGE